MARETADPLPAPPAVGAISGADVSDEELARRSLAGDAEAFDVLVRRHRDAVYQFVRWHLGTTRSEAEDVAQDVLLEVYRSLASFRGQSRLRTWILGIARNVSRQRGRAARRRARAGLDARVADGDLIEVPDARVDVVAALERQERSDAVRLAIEGLSREQRSAVLLRDVEGLSYDEIASVLEIPVGTVRSRLHNARAALARRLTASAGLREGQ